MPSGLRIGARVPERGSETFLNALQLMKSFNVKFDAPKKSETGCRKELITLIHRRKHSGDTFKTHEMSFRVSGAVEETSSGCPALTATLPNNV